MFVLSSFLSPRIVSVACRQAVRCTGPANLTCNGIRIGPSYPTVREDIAKNRENFNRDYLAFFSVARSLATKVLILHYIANNFVQQLKYNTGNILSSLKHRYSKLSF